MSTFSRRGHWRTNANGTTYWVGGHLVNSGAWGNSVYLPSYNEAGSTLQVGWANQDSQLRGYSAPRLGTMYPLVHPNGRCPTCAQAIFVYQSADSSLIFLDELGPPWASHRCAIDIPLGHTAFGALQPSSWERDNWRRLLNVKVERLNSSEVKISGFSKGILLSFLCDVDTTDLGNQRPPWGHFREVSSSEVEVSLFWSPTEKLLFSGIFATDSVKVIVQNSESCGSPKQGTPLSNFPLARFLTEHPLVNPNCRCGHCGMGLFGYRLDDGTAVLFDEVGPPWPEHVCQISSETCSHVETAPVGAHGRYRWEIAGWRRLSNASVLRLDSLTIQISGFSRGERKTFCAFHAINERLPNNTPWAHFKLSAGGAVQLSLFWTVSARLELLGGVQLYDQSSPYLDAKKELVLRLSRVLRLILSLSHEKVARAPYKTWPSIQSFDQPSFGQSPLQTPRDSRSVERLTQSFRLSDTLMSSLKFIPSKTVQMQLWVQSRLKH